MGAEIKRFGGIHLFFAHTGMKEGRYTLSGKVTATANPVLDKPIFYEFFTGFTYRRCTLAQTKTDALTFRIGNAPLPTPSDAEYAIYVGAEGAAVCAKTEQGLLHGCLTLLDLIGIDADGTVYLPYCELQERPLVRLRMVHFCVFPETELWEIQKFLRLAAALKYTHVVLEFWGMLRYSCMAELAWRQAYTPAQIRPLVQEARDLGLEIVPMFNHFGHAAAGRVMHGKHVVLDQNPALAYLFDENGWCWNYRSERVRNLLGQIRGELCDLYGAGAYFHIGCDEAYSFTEADAPAFCHYVNETAAELQTIGRRAIMWGDMMLSPREEWSGYSANAPSKACERVMRQTLSKEILMADWQYEVKTYPIQTALSLQEDGFSVLCCPWDRSNACVDANLRTVKEHALAGVLHTTWHTLSGGMPYVGRVAAKCWEGGMLSRDNAWVQLAALLRKVQFVNGDFERAGWAKQEIGVIV